MLDARELAIAAKDELTRAGADKAQGQAWVSEKHELNVDGGEINLIRTTVGVSIHLTGFKDGKKGHVNLNTGDPEALRSAALEAVSMAQASQADEANDIAEYQEPKDFGPGLLVPDKDLLFTRFQSLLDTVRERHPKIKLTMAIADFNRAHAAYVNTNGVDFTDNRGIYGFGLYFNAKDGDRVSSMSGTGIAMTEPDKEFIECGTIATLLREAEEQLTTYPVSGKFVGDIILTPDSVGDLVGMMTGPLTDGPLIEGTSIYKDSLGAAIASPLITLHSMPTGALASRYSWTGDGFASRDVTFVEKGVLKRYMLSLYGSRKTGRDEPAKSGGMWVVEPGTTAFADMIKGVRRGLLVNRISGGAPSDNGDFSAVAKNSYLIEDGVVKHPVSETMISGNFKDLLHNITAVSSERVDFGGSIFPWIMAAGVTVSGK